MGLDSDRKLNHLIKTWKNNTIKTAGTLKKAGYSYQLLDKYKKSNWLSSEGKGAYSKIGEIVKWPGAVYSLQNDLKLPIRPGGKTALEMAGYGHYIRTENQTIQLFGIEKKQLPQWFQNRIEKDNILIRNTGFLVNVNKIPLSKKEYGDFFINISAPELAYLEMLSTVPEKTSFTESINIAESLTMLRSTILQELLESCKSIKVNRLALYIAEYHQHDWFYKLNREKILLGKGKRVIQQRGQLDKKYNITIPLQDREFYK